MSLAVGLQNEIGGHAASARRQDLKTNFPGENNGRRRPAPELWKSATTQWGTASGGSFKANSLGLYDLAATFGKWCADTYKAEAAAERRAIGSASRRFMATTNRLEMQSSYRNVIDRNDRDVIYGFAASRAGDEREPVIILQDLEQPIEKRNLRGINFRRAISAEKKSARSSLRKSVKLSGSWRHSIWNVFDFNSKWAADRLERPRVTVLPLFV